MSLILNIDTALDTASVCLAKDGETLAFTSNDNRKDQAAWLHPAIHELLAGAGYSVKDLSAVSVSIGPGSYTGLRIGLSAAKGICYALQIPLITIGTLAMMAEAVKDTDADLIAPLIDARRMEVFTAIYTKDRQVIIPPAAMLLDESSFGEILANNKVLFMGNGYNKLQALITNPHALSSDQVANASHLASLSHHCFQIRDFANLAYSEPLYIKEFYSPARKSGI